MNKYLALAAFILLASTGAQAQESQQKIAVKNRQMIVVQREDTLHLADRADEFKESEMS